MATIVSTLKSSLSNSVSNDIIPSVAKYYQTTYGVDVNPNELLDIFGIKPQTKARGSPQDTGDKLTCTAITTKGLKCTNPANHGTLCGIHARGKASSKTIQTQPQPNFPQPSAVSKSGVSIKAPSAQKPVSTPIQPKKPVSTPIQPKKPTSAPVQPQRLIQPQKPASVPIQPKKPVPVPIQPKKPVSIPSRSQPPAEDVEDNEDQDTMEVEEQDQDIEDQ